MTKILIVEDEPGIYTFLKEGLIDEGYDTFVATDGSEALRDFADWKPDLVLLDWMLPTMDGIEVCRSIRETDVTTPILFLTANYCTQDYYPGLSVLTHAMRHLYRALPLCLSFACNGVDTASHSMDDRTVGNADIFLHHYFCMPIFYCA